MFSDVFICFLILNFSLYYNFVQPPIEDAFLYQSFVLLSIGISALLDLCGLRFTVRREVGPQDPHPVFLTLVWLSFILVIYPWKGIIGSSSKS